MLSSKDIHLQSIENIVSILENKTDLYDMITKSQVRYDYIKQFGFWLLAKESIEKLSSLVDDAPFIELMAGSGYISQELIKLGHRAYACDDYSIPYNGSKSEWVRKGKNIVTKMSWQEFLGQNKKLVRQKGAVVFVSWPPYAEDQMFQIAKYLKRRRTGFKGRVIYVGEPIGGCTADDDFFNSFYLKDLDENRSWGFGIEHGDFTVSFYGMHDQLFEVYPEKPDEHED